jgi:single-strand DNA-binding protein
MSVNKVILIGNVGKDPEIRHLDAGVSVANFPLATSETYTAKNGEKVTTTDWHNIVLWRGLADVAEKYVTKGKQVYIEGRIRTRSYDDKDGNKRYVTEIYGDTMQLLGKKDEQASAPPHEYVPANTKVNQPSEPDFLPTPEDDLPF